MNCDNRSKEYLHVQPPIVPGSSSRLSSSSSRRTSLVTLVPRCPLRIRSSDGKSYVPEERSYKRECYSCKYRFKAYLSEGCEGERVCGPKGPMTQPRNRNFEVIRTRTWWEMCNSGPHLHICYIGRQCRCDLWTRTHYAFRTNYAIGLRA